MNYPNQLDDKNSLFEVKDLGRTSTSKPLNAVELEIEIDNPINFPTGRHIVVVESEVIIISHRIDNILYVDTKEELFILKGNNALITSILFLDENSLVVASDDKKVNIYNLKKD